PSLVVASPYQVPTSIWRRFFSASSAAGFRRSTARLVTGAEVQPASSMLQRVRAQNPWNFIAHTPTSSLVGLGQEPGLSWDVGNSTNATEWGAMIMETEGICCALGLALSHGTSDPGRGRQDVVSV